jgi:zinc transporter ZupT
LRNDQRPDFARNTKENNMNKLALLFAGIAIAVGAWFLLQPNADQTSVGVAPPLAAGAMVAVSLPAQLTEQEQMGCQRQSKSGPKGSAKCCHFWVWSIAA